MMAMISERAANFEVKMVAARKTTSDMYMLP